MPPLHQVLQGITVMAGLHGHLKHTRLLSSCKLSIKNKADKGTLIQWSDAVDSTSFTFRYAEVTVLEGINI